MLPQPTHIGLKDAVRELDRLYLERRVEALAKEQGWPPERAKRAIVALECALKRTFEANVR